MAIEQLAIFHVQELVDRRREIVLRAYSLSDTVSLVASALDVPADHVWDRKRFGIMEVNYGDEFLAAGPRGVIAVF